MRSHIPNHRASRVSRALSCLAGAGVLLSAALPSAGIAQDRPAAVAPEMATATDVLATKAGGNTDPTGATGPLSERGRALFRPPVPKGTPAALYYACLEMDYDNSSNRMWLIDAKGTISGGNFNISSATVSGAICDSPNWSVTGTIGVNENIVGLNTTSPTFDPACNRKITIKGSLQGFVFWQGPVPPTTIGTTSGYNFPSMGPNQWFPQTTHLRSLSPIHQVCK